MDEAIQRGCRFDGVVGRLVQDIDEMPASIQVLSVGEKSSLIEFSYRDRFITKNFPVSVVDYSSPPLAKFARLKYMKNIVDATWKDLSASVFVPSCSEFRRLGAHTYPTNLNRWRMTPQGCFSFSRLPIMPYRMVVCFLNAGLILGIIGGVTGFRVGQSSIAEQNWTLHWYIFGAVYSGFAIWDGIQRRPWPEPDMGAPSKHDIWWNLVPLVLYGIPAIGGFVTVITMLFDWGNCTFY